MSYSTLVASSHPTANTHTTSGGTEGAARATAAQHGIAVAEVEPCRCVNVDGQGRVYYTLVYVARGTKR